MERPKRIFVPEGVTPSENLEQRICMSVSRLPGSLNLPGSNSGSSSGSTRATPSNVPGFGATSNSYNVRRDQRIERVPASFAMIDPTQTIPRPITAAIQADLRQLLGTIPGRSMPDQRQAMNQLLKAMIPYQGVSAQAVTALNNVFGEMLVTAGANPATVASLQNNMLQATQASIQSSSQPSFAVTNNYIYMYYVATTVGWQIPVPGAPQLMPKLNQNPSGNPVTASRRPQFTGNYTPNMLVEIYDVSNGNLIGKGMTNTSGRFVTTSSMMLNPGTYTLTARGVTPGGEASQFSAWTVLTVTGN